MRTCLVACLFAAAHLGCASSKGSRLQRQPSTATPGFAALEQSPFGSADMTPTRVIEEKTTVEGACDKASIEALLRAETKFDTCYAEALERTPSTRGTVRMRFTITADGSVEGVETVVSHRTTYQDHVFQACLATVLYDVEHSRPKSGECVVFYSFVYPKQAP